MFPGRFHGLTTAVSGCWPLQFCVWFQSDAGFNTRLPDKDRRSENDRRNGYVRLFLNTRRMQESELNDECKC